MRTTADQWRRAVVRGYLWVAVVTTALLSAVPLVTGTVEAGWAGMVATAASSVLSLSVLLTITRWPALTRWAGGFTVLQAMAVLIGLEVLTEGTQDSVRASLVIVPFLAAFLAGRRFVWPLYGILSLALLILATARSSDNPTAIMDLVALILVAGLVAGLSWVAETQRERWQRRALAQQRDLAEAVDQAREAARARTAFLATMSHEIRTPLNGVLGLTRLLTETDLDPDQRELAGTALSSGRLLKGVLDDVLDLARLESGQVELDERPTDVRTLAREVVELLHVGRGRAGVTTRIEVDEDVPAWVSVDDTRLRQVLGNLVSNALKFTPDGEVLLRVHRDDAQTLCIVVEDTGIGIDPDQTAVLFEPFVQADASTARRFGGTGLGLAICARLTMLMGGSIGAEALDRGSRFWFTVRAPATHAPSLSDDGADDLSGLTLLVAEDNPVNRMVIERTLQRLGATVRLAEDGQAALDALDAPGAGLPDMVLMDCHMPGMDGFEAARQIRARPGLHDLPIVAVTASVTLDDRRHILEAGMDGIVAKPLQVGDLCLTLRTVLAERSRTRRAG